MTTQQTNNEALAQSRAKGANSMDGLGAAMECRSIETAPRVGTPIILLYFDGGRVCWVRDGKFVPPIGWYSINGTGGLHPTHWMPMPEAPNDHAQPTVTA